MATALTIATEQLEPGSWDGGWSKSLYGLGYISKVI